MTRDPTTETMGFTKEILKAAAGVSPVRGNTVTVHCTGVVTATGKKFWSTKDPGQEPFSFKIGLGQVIRGWDEGVMTMKVGEEARFVMSPDFAYGASGFPAWGIPKNAELTFTIELLGVK